MNFADFTDCFAVPGEHVIIDVVHPLTGLTHINGENLEKVRQRYPKAEQMPLAEFIRLKAIQQDAEPLRWKEISEDEFNDAMDALPPAVMIGGCFLLGEPFDTHAGTGYNRYCPYVQRQGKFYGGTKPLTVPQFRDFMTTRPVLEIA